MIECGSQARMPSPSPSPSPEPRTERVLLRPINVQPLSSAQERRLLRYVEDQFLSLMRDFKKRSQPTSRLSTLLAYLDAAHALFSIIMQIPPADPSAALRTTLLLRLTGDVLGSVPGYNADSPTLEALLAWLRDLDAGWVATLKRQGWDAQDSNAYNVHLPSGIGSKPMSTTERARLRSLIIGGTNTLEEWLATSANAQENLEAALERMGLERGFEDLFVNTLAEMGALGGVSVNLDPSSTRPDRTL